MQQLHGVIHCREQRKCWGMKGIPQASLRPGDTAHLACRGWAGWAELSGGPESREGADGWG